MAAASDLLDPLAHVRALKLACGCHCWRVAWVAEHEVNVMADLRDDLPSGIGPRK